MLAGDVVTLCCVDCYGTASFYPEVAKQLFPGKEIRWIHVQSEREIQKGYQASFRATRQNYAENLILDPDSADSWTRVVARLKHEGVIYNFGGMETGAQRADELNFRMNIAGSNDPRTSHWRREKEPMQARLAKKIPTLLTNKIEDVLDFADRQNSSRLVLKPNASSSAEGVFFVDRKNKKAIKAAFDELRSLGKDQYGHFIDEIVVQPEIVGQEFVGESIARHGVATLVGMYRYIKIPLGDLRIYFIDDPVDLTSPLAASLRPVVQQTHTDLDNLNGPGHGEYILEENTGEWFVVEQAARVGGAGMAMLDAEIWGTGHLHLNLLRVLDPARYEIETSRFQNKPISPHKTGITLFLVSRKAGVIAEGTEAFLHSLPTYRAFSDYYDIYDGQSFEATKDLTTVAGIIYLVGNKDAVLRDAEKILARQKKGNLLAYKRSSGVWNRCAEILGDLYYPRRHSNLLKTYFDQWSASWSR